MKAPQPAWDATYAHDRRAHRHRCRCCSRIVEAGEAVVMARVDGRTTWTIHAACAAKPFTRDGRFTWRDAMVAWGTSYLIRCGHKLEHHALHFHREPAL